jgi:F-type H+-transporting ATPase subunit b
MDATSWATLWALVGLLIFLGIAVYIKAPAMLAKSLDERGKRISDELDEARRLREEAKALLAEYQKKRKEAEAEAADILTAAKREAELFVEDAKAKAEDYVARRTASAEQKIAQAERDAVNEVRSLAADIAVEAARATIAAKVDAKTTASLFQSSLQALKAKLN